MEYFILALLWIVWCAIHSGMISVTATKFFKRVLGGNYRFFRLSYNLIALGTFLYVIYYSHSLEGPELFRWSGPLIIIQSLAIGVVAYLCVAGMLIYDMWQFLGVRQIKSGLTHSTLSESEDFITRGILGITRHPWYLAALIIIWTDYHIMHTYELLTNVMLTSYVIIGTLMEERKLILEYGNAYRAYQQKVSMLFPFKWLKTMLP